MMGYPSIATSLASLRNDYEDFHYAAAFVAELLNRLDKYKIPPKTILNIIFPVLKKKILQA